MFHAVVMIIVDLRSKHRIDQIVTFSQHMNTEKLVQDLLKSRTFIQMGMVLDSHVLSYHILIGGYFLSSKSPILQYEVLTLGQRYVLHCLCKSC